MKNLILILTLTLLACCNPKTDTLKVDRILDGDSFEVSGNSFRIAEIDAPEYSQQYGVESKNYLSNLILNKKVKISVKSTDKYGRKIAEVFVDGRKVSELMVASGNAMQYRYYSRDKRLSDLELTARTQKLGLWKYNNAVEPYQFRKKHEK